MANQFDDGSKTTRERFEEKFTPGPIDECWPWLAKRFGGGYGQFWNGTKSIQAHRYCYELYIGPIPDGQVICHRCDHPWCVNPFHFFLGTHAENMRDMVAKGRQMKPQGEKCGTAKLKTGDIQAIRVDNRSQQVIAESYKISRAQVRRIQKRQSWAHV